MNELAFSHGWLQRRSGVFGLLLLFAFARTVLAAGPPQVFTDADGDIYTVRLTGPGVAVVTLDDPDADTKGPIASIALTGTDATSALTIAVAKVGNGRVNVGAITGAGAVKSINTPQCDFNGAGIALGSATSLRLGDVAAGANIAFLTRPKVRPLAISARNVGAMQLTAPSSTLTFTARSVTGGAQISAAQIAAFKVTDGNCAADIATPGRLVSLSVKGGDFSGHIAARTIGTLSITRNAAGDGGSLTDSTITARNIGTLLLARDFVNSLVLAGASLGADGALGGTGANADSFTIGNLGTVRVGGAMTNSILGAGFTPLDGKFRDGNDATLGGRLTVFTVRGQIDAQSLVGATILPQFVSVNRVKLRPRRDAHFVFRKVTIPNAPVVTQLDQTKAVPAAVATSFLYVGPNAVQTGVTPGTIKPARAAVLRGRVLSRDSLPLAGIEISVLDHVEFGLTRSRANGMFDMAVNGGGPLTVRFDSPGLCPVQRQIDVRQQDFEVLGDVVMVGVDPAMTTVTLGAGSAMQMHEATMQDDDSDPRHAALMFQPDTSAMFKMADGTTQPVAAPLSIRATEFTVGPNGPNAMPGVLPPNSAYTYCAELSADETPAGATLEFTKPVYLYVENFLHFESGASVPSGFYDLQKGQWVAGPSGRIIKIVTITANAADLDVNGDNVPDTGTTLTALGITDAERTQLATSYNAGQSLWRVPIPHFSAWDCNWAFGPPPGSGPPNPPPPTNDNPPNDPDDPPNIFVQSQSVGERVSLAGVPFGLTYRSERVPGRIAARRLKVPLDGGSLPGPVKRVEMEVSVGGRSFVQMFSAVAGQTASFEWDGLDAYGRAVPGRQTASVRIGYVYDGDYARTNRFGFPGTGVVITGDYTRKEITLSTTRPTFIGATDVRFSTLAGWTFDIHHRYDPVSRRLHLGDGSARQAESINATIKSVVGTGQAFTAGFNNDNIPAAQARLLRPAFCVTAEDGTLYFSDAGLHQIFRVTPDGTLRVVAGVAQSAGYNGDERPALGAQLGFCFGLAVAPDGTLFFVDAGNRRVRSITPDGIIHTVAGTGVTGYSGDGGPATAAQMNGGVNLMRARDGTLFISDTNNFVIRRVGTDGIISTVAGTGVAGFSGDGGPATAAQMREPLGTALDADGNLYIADGSDRRIRRVGPDGIIRTIAGTGAAPLGPTDPAGDGGPAIAAQIGFPNGISLDREGNLYIADGGIRRIRKVSRTGLMTSVAGTGALPVNGAPNGDGGAALQASSIATDVAVAPDGSIYITDELPLRIRQLIPPLPGFSGGELAIPSADGEELYRFDATGRHLSTVHALTGAPIYTFAYDSDGQLVKVTDGDGNATTIQRSASGAPTAIVGPFGDRTTVTTDANGSLTRVQGPDGSAHVFTYDAGGLLTAETDPTGQTHTFSYNADGLLTLANHAGPAQTTLTRVEIPNGYFVTTTSALGLVDKYQVETFTNGDELRTNSDAAGVLTTDRRRASGVQTFTPRDGMSVTVTLGPDARFGLQAPFDAKTVVTTPGGKTNTLTRTETATLASAGNPLSLTAATRTFALNGATFTRAYDAAARTWTTTSALGRVLTETLDAQGRGTRSGRAGTASVETAFNADGQPATLTLGSGADAQVTRFTYKNGYVATSVNALNQTEKFAHNAFGLMTERTRADGSKLLAGYDAAHRFTSLTPPGRAAHTFTHTPWGQMASYTAPDAGSGPATTTLSYDADQRWTGITYPGGETIVQAYDSAGRLQTRTAGGVATTLAYHPTSGVPTSLATAGGETITLSHDGSIFTGTTWSGAVAGSATRTLNDLFATASQSINGANTVNFTYDADGSLTAAGDLAITRDAARGWLTGTTLGVVADAHTFDTFGQLTGYTASANGAAVFNTQTSYDQLGRVTRSVETVAGGAADTFDYAYDVLGRLREVKKNGAVSESFTYDANANRLTVGALTAASDAQDRLTQLGAATFTHSPTGYRLTRTEAGATTSYSYDAYGALIGFAAPGQTAVEYLTDPRGRRVGKKVGGALVQGFLYDGGTHVLAELDGANAVVSVFIYGERASVPSWMIRGGVKYRLVADVRGSVRLVVNSATGAVAQRLDYNAYGDVLADTNPGFQPFGFAGGLYDPATRLTRFGPREDDAATGVWLQKDPFLFKGRQLNLYAYGAGDPINSVDVSGRLFTAANVLLQLGQDVGGDIGHTTINAGDGFQGFGGDQNTTPFDPNHPWAPQDGLFHDQLHNPDVVIDFWVTPEQLARVKKFIKEQREKKRKYNIFYSNCRDYVLDALLDAGIIPNKDALPNTWFWNPRDFAEGLRRQAFRNNIIAILR